MSRLALDRTVQKASRSNHLLHCNIKRIGLRFKGKHATVFSMCRKTGRSSTLIRAGRRLVRQGDFACLHWLNSSPASACIVTLTIIKVLTDPGPDGLAFGA